MARKKPATASLDHIVESLRPMAVPIADLIIDPANARKHPEKNLDALVGSLQVYGQRKPVVVNQRNNVVEAGNGTVAAAINLGWSHLAAVFVDDDPSTAAGFSIADNRTAELAEWDNDALDALLREIDTGSEALQQMLADLADEAGLYQDEQAEVTEDEAPEPPVDPITKPGDLWLLGEHKLLCGDSTKAEDVARLMNGERADLCFTSPPYGQQREYTKESDCSDWDKLMQGVFGNLPMSDTGQVLVNLGMIHRDGEWVPYWDGWIEWMRSQGWRRFGWYVWDQGPGLPGDWNGRLAPSHEFIFHFNRASVRPEKTKDCKWAGESNHGSGLRGSDNQVSGYCHAGLAVQDKKIPDSVIREMRHKARGIEVQHPAVFSVPLAAEFLAAWPGLAYEPFSGSGTTIIAAEQLKRRCFAIEISPQYCDVAVARWEKLTGKKATLETPSR